MFTSAADREIAEQDWQEYEQEFGPLPLPVRIIEKEPDDYSVQKEGTPMTTKQIEQVEEIDSPYFGEEDVLDIQTRLIDMGYIDPVTDQNAALADPLVLAKSLDRLMDILIAGIIEYPEDMLFNTCDGNHRHDFERAVKSVVAQNGKTKNEQRN